MAGLMFLQVLSIIEIGLGSIIRIINNLSLVFKCRSRGSSQNIYTSIFADFMM